MDAVTVGVAQGVVAAVHVGQLGPRESGDDRPVHRAGDGLHGVEVTLARDRETGLDVVDAEACQLLGDLELLARVERNARRLLTVSQSRVEDDHLVAHHSLRPRGATASFTR